MKSENQYQLNLIDKSSHSGLCFSFYVTLPISLWANFDLNLLFGFNFPNEDSTILNDKNKKKINFKIFLENFNKPNLLTFPFLYPLCSCVLIHCLYNEICNSPIGNLSCRYSFRRFALREFIQTFNPLLTNIRPLDLTVRCICVQLKNNLITLYDK